MKFSLEFPLPGYALVPKSELTLQQMAGAKPWLLDNSKLLVPVEVAIQAASVVFEEESRGNDGR